MRVIATIITGISIIVAGLIPARAQQPYPSRPVAIVVPYQPGGVTDFVARLYAQKLTARLGTPFTVENKPGGAGMIGTDFIGRSAPNGYTLGIFLDSNTIAPALLAKMGTDPIKDFTPVTMLAAGAHIVVAHPSFAPNTIKELIDYAKSKPGEPYASSGLGTAQHLGMEMIKLKAGIDLSHVPYKGGGQAITDVVGGQVKVAVLGLAPVLPFLRSGQLKALAVTGEKRTSLLPNVPTVSETLPGVTTLQWFAVVGPAGLPQDVVQKLYREFVAVSQDPDVEQKLTSVGLEVRNSTRPSELSKFMEQDLLKWPPIVKAAGIKLE
jgi:tripartite-type tricarboxylate transporter receptor subunit TctC